MCECIRYFSTVECVGTVDVFVPWGPFSDCIWVLWPPTLLNLPCPVFGWAQSCSAPVICDTGCWFPSNFFSFVSLKQHAPKTSNLATSKSEFNWSKDFTRDITCWGGGKVEQRILSTSFLFSLFSNWKIYRTARVAAVSLYPFGPLDVWSLWPFCLTDSFLPLALCPCALCVWPLPPLLHPKQNTTDPKK